MAILYKGNKILIEWERGGIISNQTIFDTALNTKPVIITRGVDTPTLEGVKIGVTDSDLIIDYDQDESSSNIIINLNCTDIEGGTEGANASSRSVVFSNNSSKLTARVDGEIEAKHVIQAKSDPTYTSPHEAFISVIDSVDNKGIALMIDHYRGLWDNSNQNYFVRLSNDGKYLCFPIGNAGFGVDSPSYRVQVGGACAATSFPNLSDERLKENIVNLDNITLEQIANAPIVKFKWKDSEDSGFGTLAQYWEEIAPYAISKDNDGHLSIQYGALAFVNSVVLAREIKKLKEQLKECINT